MRQFSLLSLIMSTVLLALSLANFGVWGVLVWPILLAVVAHFRRIPTWNEALGSVGLLLLCLAALVPFALIAYTSTDTGGHLRMQCLNNVKSLGCAVLCYEGSHGKFPPVRESDRQGSPPHSWRYLILPYTDEKALFQKYSRNEPWNGPNNSKLAGQIPRWDVCPSDTEAFGRTQTSYVAVVGADGTWLPHESSQGSNSLNPVLVIEMRGLAIGCLEPRDVSVDEICNADEDALASHREVRNGFFLCRRFSGTSAVFADGHAQIIPADLPRDVLRRVLLGDRRAQAMLDEFPLRSLRIQWLNCLSLACLVICFIVMIIWPKRKDTDAVPTPDPAGGT